MRAEQVRSPLSRHGVARRIAATVWLLLSLAACNGDPLSTSNTTTTSQAPTITSQPASITVTAPAAATFSVTATGSTPLSFQWFRDGTTIMGATQSTFTLAATSASDNGAVFTVTVSNNLGSVTSSGATLTVR